MEADNVVILWPRQVRHDRTASRAAKRAISAAVTPALRDFESAQTAAHHSAGMQSRRHHLLTASANSELPSSVASATRVGHNSMIDRNESTPVMESAIGQFGLSSKANMADDCRPSTRHNQRMSKTPLTRFEKEFLARTKAAREARGYTQGEMGLLLGIPRQDQYKHFENRTLLHHHLIEPFCLACEIDIYFLVTGKERRDQATAPSLRQRSQAAPVRRNRRHVA